jgi:hypothetical protein
MASRYTVELLRKIPYEDRICRLEHYPDCLSPPDPDGVPRATIQQAVDAIAEAGTQVWSVAAMRHNPEGVGKGRSWPLWDSKMIPRPTEWAEDAERLKEFVEQAHKRGILMLSYYPFIFTTPIHRQHPEWGIQMLDDGGEEVWNEGWLCWNSPYRDWLPQYLNEMIGYFDLDGVYFDDMNWGSHSDTGQRRTGGCACGFCKEQYLEETGRELPTRVDMEDADFRRYIVWRYGKFTDGVEHVAKGVYAEHPDAILDWNYYGRPYGSPDTGWKSGHPLNPLPTTTHFFMEAGLDNLGVSFPAKLLRAAGPTFGYFFNAARSAGHIGPSPCPEPYTGSVAALSAVARGGASVTVGVHAGSFTHWGDALERIFSEAKQLRQYVSATSIKHVALHVSQQSRDFQYYTDIDEFWRLCRGSDEMLKRSQLLTEVVFDDHLTVDTLCEYQVLMLTNSGCLSDSQADAIREFVNRGGCLIATHQSSLFDELGRNRGNFAVADVLGVDYATPENGEVLDPEDGSTDPGETNIIVPQTQQLKTMFGHFLAFEAGQSEISLRSDSEPEVLFTKSGLQWRGTRGPLSGEFFDRPDLDSGRPALTRNRFGKGTAIYICGDLGQGFYRSPLPQLRQLLALLARTTRPAIEVEAPQMIDLTACRRNPGQLMVHLLNNPLPMVPWDTSRGSPYFCIDEILPARDVVIRLNEFKAGSVSLPLHNRSLEPGADGKQIVVPEVGLHEIVLVDLA